MEAGDPGDPPVLTELTERCGVMETEAGDPSIAIGDGNIGGLPGEPDEREKVPDGGDGMHSNDLHLRRGSGLTYEDCGNFGDDGEHADAP